MFPFFSRPVLKSLSFTTGRGFANQAAFRAQNGKDHLARKLSDLNDHLKNTGRVPTRDFLSGLKEMTQPGTEVTPIQGLLMLRCCGSLLQEETREKRNELAEQTWSALIDRNVQLDISHYNALLRIYLENEKNFDPLQFLEDLEAKNLQPNRVTYQRIIHHFCTTGQMAVAAKLLLVIKEKNVPLTDTIFNSLLMGHIKTGDFDGYRSTLKMMKEVGLEPTDETYAVILSAAAEMSSGNSRFIDLFQETWKEAENNNVFLSNQRRFEIAIRIPENQTGLFNDFITSCGKEGGDYNTDCFNAILEAVNLRKLDFAMTLLKTMNRPNSPQYQSGNFLIRQMVKTNIELSRVKEICGLLKQEGLNEWGLSAAVESAFEHLDLDPCRAYLKHFVDGSEEKLGRAHYYWPLLTKCTTDSQLVDVLAQDMASVAKISSARSILDTFEEYVWTKNIRDPALLIDQLKTAGFSSSLMLTSLVNHHIQNHRFEEALKVLKNYHNLHLYPRYIAPNLALAFAKKGDLNEFVSILKKLRTMSSEVQDDSWIGRCLLLYVRTGGQERIPVQQLVARMGGLPISEAVLDALKEKNLLQEQDIQMLLASDLHGTEGEAVESVDGLENLLIELKSKGMSTRGCLRKLILAYCKTPADDSDYIVKRVDELLSDLNRQGFVISPALNASLMAMYANHGRVDEALEIKQKIPPEFKIDPFKILDLATAMINSGKTNEVLDLIQEQTKRFMLPIDQNPVSVERNVHKVLTAAAEVTRDAKFVSHLLELVLPLVNVTKPTNVMMGPMIRVHLLNDNLDGALEEFAHAASNFRLAPWKGELMKRVIELDDPKKLQMLTDISVSHHGEPSTLLDVAVAFIKAGKLMQAKKVTTHPSFPRKDRAILHRIAERLVLTNDVESLQKLIELISQATTEIDMEPLYFQLIRGYAAQNNPGKALDVWTAMQEQEILPAPKTLRYLGSFLKDSGVSVPFDYTNLKSDNKPPAQKPREKSSSDYSSTVISADLEDVLKQRRKIIKDGQSPSVADEGNLIERLVTSGRHRDAVDILRYLMKKGLFPVPQVFRKVIGALNQLGDVDTMEEIREKLPEQLKNQAWYTNQLAYCYLNAGQEEKLMDEVLPKLKPCPLSALLVLLQKRPDFERRILDLAERVFKEDNFALVYNAVWSYRMICHRFEEARNLFRAVPQLKDTLSFQSLISRVRSEKDLELADALASTIEESNMLGRKLAIVYDAKIDALIDLDRAEEAEKYLMQVMADHSSKSSKISLQDFRRSTLIRLRQKLIEVCDREPSFAVPQTSRNEANQTKQRNVSSL